MAYLFSLKFLTAARELRYHSENTQDSLKLRESPAVTKQQTYPEYVESKCRMGLLA